MRLRDLAFLAGTAGAAMLTYGVLVESKNLVVERHTLPLPLWPERLRGYRIAVLSDLHIRDPWSLEVAKRAVAIALDESPDMIVLPGDLVAYWKPEMAQMVGDCLEPLLLMEGKVVAVPGNHEYLAGDPSLLAPILSELNIRFLRNETWRADGITWVGIDSAVKAMDRPQDTMLEVRDEPAICLWHEPDAVGRLPSGCALQISGHSHGGQFRFPGGFTPMYTYMGKLYPRGFYPDAPTPLYVSRGVGTTGPPSRFMCPPEVSLLTLEPASG